MDKQVTSDVRSSDTKTMAQPTSNKKGGFLRWLVVLIIVLVIILAGLFVVSKVTGWNVLGIDKGSASGEWQAVFLSNGQVYFGQITSENTDTIVVEDIYYLQVTKSLQPAEGDAQQQNELSLVKLGNELHGPEDEMRINRAHVLFIENLKEEGKVVRAIQRYVEEAPETSETPVE
jgi:hypothetical protein